MSVNIILVDDNKENLRQMNEALKDVEDIRFEENKIDIAFHQIEPVLDDRQSVNFESTIAKFEKMDPGVAIVDMRLEGDLDNDLSGVELSQRIKEKFEDCCIVLVSAYFQSASERIRYLDVFRHCVDRLQPAEQYIEQLQASLRSAVKTHVGTRRYRNQPVRTGQDPNNKAVFISYGWDDEGDEWPGREDIAQRLYESLASDGFAVHWDRELGYRSSISEFMHALASGRCVVAVISDKYLRSPYCMSELLEIARNGELKQRLIPIVLKDANIKSAGQRLRYLAYWHHQVELLNEEVNRHGLRPMLGGQTLKDLERFVEIEDNLEKMLLLILDMHLPPAREIADQGFSLVKKEVDECLKRKARSELSSIEA